jgi:hypothetical protein
MTRLNDSSSRFVQHLLDTNLHPVIWLYSSEEDPHYSCKNCFDLVLIIPKIPSAANTSKARLEVGKIFTAMLKSQLDKK